MAKKETRNFHLQMHHICIPSDLRPVMEHIYFDKGHMIATDGLMLMKAAVLHFSDFEQTEVEMLNGKFIHYKTLKKILACNFVTVTPEGIRDEETKDIYRFSEQTLKYPEYEKIFPKELQAVNLIGLTPHLVMRLMKVLSAPSIISVSCKFHGAGRALLIEGIGDNDGALQCILMPVNLSE